MKEIYDLLKNVGLSEVESKIYLKLLELGSVSVTDLSKSMNMNRITVHFNVQNLLDKGLITHVKKGRSRELTVQPPSSLEYLIEQKEKNIAEIKEQFTKTLPLMQNLTPLADKSKSDFDVKFYQGLNGVRAIYREAYKSKNISSYVNIRRLLEVFPESPQQFTDLISHSNIKMREIVDNSEFTKDYVKNMHSENYQYKFFPHEWNLNLFDQMIFDGKIAMVTTSKELNGVIIANQNLYLNSLAIFDTLWNLLSAPKLEK